MKRAHVIALLTAVLRAQDPSLDGDQAVLEALRICAGGMSDEELLDAVAVIVRDGSRSSSTGADCSAAEIVLDVTFALALRSVFKDGDAADNPGGAS